MICNIHPPKPSFSSNNRTRWPGHTETRQIMMGQESISTRLSPLFYCGHRALEVNGSMYSEKKDPCKRYKSQKRIPPLCFSSQGDCIRHQHAATGWQSDARSHLISYQQKVFKMPTSVLNVFSCFFLLLLLSSWCPHRTTD